MQLAFCEKAKGEKVDCVHAMQSAFGQKAKGEIYKMVPVVKGSN